MKARSFRIALRMSLLALLGAKGALGFPLLVSVADHPELEGLTRESMGVFTWAKGALVRLPLQIDEMEERTFVVMRQPSVEMPGRRDMHHPPERDPFQGKLRSFHRLAVDARQARPCAADCRAALPGALAETCGPQASWEARIPDGASLFFASCAKKVPSSGNVVSFDASTRTLKTDAYELVYSKKSPLLLESLRLGGDAPILGGSAMEVRINPRYFFKLNFDESNIQPQITAIQYGPVSAIAELALALKTMGLRTSFQICCDMSAYRDGFYLPVLVEIPFAALKNVSGVFYGFEFPGDMARDVETNMPRFSELEKTSEKRSFNYIALTQGERTLAIGIRSQDQVPPTYVVGREDLRKLEFKEANANLGFFVDMSKMSSGKQRLEIWYAVGPREDKARLVELAAQGLRYSWHQGR